MVLNLIVVFDCNDKAVYMASVNSLLIRLNISSGKQATLSVPCRPIGISNKCLFGISNGSGVFYREDDDADDDDRVEFVFHCSLEGDWPSERVQE